MIRVLAPEPVTGRVVGLVFAAGVAVVDSLERPAELWLRTHGYQIVPVEPEPVVESVDVEDS